MPTEYHKTIKINFQTYKNLEKFAEDSELIEKRLLDLKSEWDIERTLGVMVSLLSLICLFLSQSFHTSWFFVSIVLLVILLQQSLFGWNPILPLLRKLGKRSLHEIEEERHALKALRGDYVHVESPAEALEDSMKD